MPFMSLMWCGDANVLKGNMMDTLIFFAYETMSAPEQKGPLLVLSALVLQVASIFSGI